MRLRLLRYTIDSTVGTFAGCIITYENFVSNPVYASRQGKAIPIPINDNWDEAAAR